MPNIRPISDLRNNANKIFESEVEIANGVEGENFFELAKSLSINVHGTI